jgi:hypothetical protein
MVSRETISKNNQDQERLGTDPNDGPQELRNEGRIESPKKMRLEDIYQVLKKRKLQ